jgi:hypothetical protein
VEWVQLYGLQLQPTIEVGFYGVIVTILNGPCLWIASSCGV